MGKIEPEKEIKKVVLLRNAPRGGMFESDFPHVPGGRKRTGMHHRGDDGVGRPPGNVFSSKRNTGRRRGKP